MRDGFSLFQSRNRGVLSVTNPRLSFNKSLHPDIRDRVFYLEGNHMHSSIQKVPALVLDCEPNIDFNREIEAKRQYAFQVVNFFEFVKKRWKDTLDNAISGDDRGLPPVALPPNDRLWMLNGKRFKEAA